MMALRYTCLSAFLVLLASCGQGTEEAREDASPAEEGMTADTETMPAEPVEIEPGLTMRILSGGAGAAVEPGQTAVVHYTGWLFDPAAPDNRGQKFDSSRDRGQHFQFEVGAREVIAGWDRGVAGMQIGEVRELTIAPELAYGERGAGGVIPPDSTLVFEVELADVVGEAAATTE